MRISFLLVLILFSGQILSQSLELPKAKYYNPRWSSDGKMILFEEGLNGHSTIFYKRLNDANVYKISDTLNDYGQADWSPDAKSVIYYGGAHPMQLFVNSISGNSERKISTIGDAYEPSWSKQDKIIFTSRPDRRTFNDLSIVNADGTGYKLITDSKYNYSAPQWSPDGTKIVFERSVAIDKAWKEITSDERRAMKDSAEIFMMDGDGSHIIRLTNDSIRQKSPSWSNDGKAVCFMTENKEGVEIIKMDLKTRIQIRLAQLKGTIYNFDISPDEKSIVYASERDGWSSIYIYDLKSGTERKEFLAKKN